MLINKPSDLRKGDKVTLNLVGGTVVTGEYDGYTLPGLGWGLVSITNADKFDGDIETVEVERTVVEPQRIGSVALHPDGKFVLVRENDSTARYRWMLASGDAHFYPWEDIADDVTQVYDGPELSTDVAWRKANIADLTPGTTVRINHPNPDNHWHHFQALVDVSQRGSDDVYYAWLKPIVERPDGYKSATFMWDIEDLEVMA